ncbi:DUF4367 domain-containing protein [Methanocalculus taiwanensis]|uniref:DUF4367 domain-containing protein n=1 Tax=Methanocalculus taiwanensis TaxID=106207 RepID=A0ABD4THE5_9EURY|nr:DUF4367 domain-containing protein [Methanocalculus taiwanensis]MCQ1538111.1 DUF4367 domain-containing protein [Methanocalculus taiwanensis]
MTRNLLTTFILILLTAACLLSAGCTVPAGHTSGDTAPANVPNTPDNGTGAEISPTPTGPNFRITPLFFTSLHTMQRTLDPEICLSLPGYLPEGYLFSDGAWAPTSDTGWRIVGYQRGNERIVLNQQPLDKGTFPIGSAWASRAPAEITIGGEPATLVEGKMTEIIWSRDDLAFRLVGTLSAEEMIRIAESIHPAPYDPDTPPPYEFLPPANPMEKRFEIGQTVSADNRTVTFVSLECNQRKCEAVFFVDLVASPTFDPPPGGTSPTGSPDPVAGFRVDNGLFLRTTESYSYRDEGDGTLIFWKTDPIPADAGVFHATFTQFREQKGLWEFNVSL